jgi:hypothetical protein
MEMMGFTAFHPSYAGCAPPILRGLFPGGTRLLVKKCDDYPLCGHDGGLFVEVYDSVMIGAMYDGRHKESLRNLWR